MLLLFQSFKLFTFYVWEEKFLAFVPHVVDYKWRKNKVELDEWKIETAFHIHSEHIPFEWQNFRFKDEFEI